MGLDYLTLYCFITIAETGSFTEAAEKVGRTQSAVSQKIAKLEELLGVTLLVRGKQLQLTNEGELFLNYARQIFNLYSEALDLFNKPELKGEISFGLPEDFATLFLSDVLVDFSRIHPFILLNSECDLTLNLLDRFKRGEFDLVLVKATNLHDFPDELGVLSEKLEWVGSSKISAKSYYNNILPLVLAPHPCVYRARAIESLEKQHIKWRVVFSSPSYAGTVAAVKAGLGLTVMPRNMINSDLRIVNEPFLPPLDNTHISLLRRDKSNPIINSFEEFIMRRLKRP